MDVFTITTCRKDGYKDNEGLCHFPGTDNPEVETSLLEIEILEKYSSIQEMDSDDEVCEVSLGADLYTRFGILSLEQEKKENNKCIEHAGVLQRKFQKSWPS